MKFALFIIGVSCSGQATGLFIKSVSPQQIVADYTAPSSAACTISVTDNSGLGVTVFDVSAKFTNSNQDLSRSDTVVLSGNTREVVIGHRTAEVGTDGLLYSRSLQQNTPHTLTVCGTSVNFQTLNPPIGAMYPDPPSFNASGFGNAAWPSVNWGTSATLQNSTPYIDPKTGILLKPASWFGQLSYIASAEQFGSYFDINGTWTNAANILSGSSGSLASSSNTNPIFIALPGYPFQSGGGAYWVGSNWVGFTLDDLRIHFTGDGNNSGGLGVNFCITPDSGQTCISSTQSVTLNMTTPTTVCFPSNCTSTAFPAPPFTEWGMTSFPQHNIVVPPPMYSFAAGTLTNIVVASNVGTVTLSQYITNISNGQSIAIGGSATSALNGVYTAASVSGNTFLITTSGVANGTYTAGLVLGTVRATSSGTTLTNSTAVPSATGLFPTNLAAGSKVLVTGSTCTNMLCTVASVTNASTMILNENISTTATSATIQNFGLKIWKANATGTINLTTTFDVGYTGTPNFAAPDGGSQQCAANPMSLTQNAAGSTVAAYSAYLCTLSWQGSSTIVYALIPSTGEMRPLAFMSVPYNPPQMSRCENCGPSPDSFGADGYTIYAQGQRADDSSYQVFKWVYRGLGQQYVTGAIVFNGGYEGGYQGPATCLGSEVLALNLCVSLVTGYGASPTNDLKTQANTCEGNGWVNAGVFGTPQAIGIEGNIFINQWHSQQDGIGLITYVDVTTGLMTGCIDTMFSSNSGRFGGLHTAGGVAGNYNLLTLNPLGSRGNSGPFAGPYKSLVSYFCSTINGSGSCTSWNSNTAIPASGRTTYTCPSSICGSNITGAMLIRISGQPCSSAANSAEYTTFPCPWNAAYGMLSALQVGDFLGDLTQSAGAASEQLKILALIPNTSTDIQVWVLGGYGSDGTNTCPQNQPPGLCRSSFANGWSVSPYPSGSDDSAHWWLPYTSPSSAVIYDYSIIGSHLDVGPSATGATYYNFSIDSPAGKFNTAANGTGFAQAANALGSFGVWNNSSANFPVGGGVESYPSCRVYIAVPNFCMDKHFYQSGGGAGQGGAGATYAGTTFTAVGGQNHVWKMTVPYTVNPKTNPLETWSGRFIYQDISGPSSTITDSNNNAFCITYKANECVSGSSVGDVYVSDSAAIITSNMYTDQMDANLPSATNAAPMGDYAVQQDISQANAQGSLQRRAASDFSTAGRQYSFTTVRTTPEGSWLLLLNQWADGVFPMMWMAKLPPWPGYDSIRRDSYIQSPVQIGPGAALAEVRFNYYENGGYCTTRAEGCVTKASPSASQPFNFLTADGHSGTSCASGCTIPVPAIAGRILNWQVYRSSDGGTTWIAGASGSTLN